MRHRAATRAQRAPWTVSLPGDRMPGAGRTAGQLLQARHPRCRRGLPVLARPGCGQADVRQAAATGGTLGVGSGESLPPRDPRCPRPGPGCLLQLILAAPALPACGDPAFPQDHWLRPPRPWRAGGVPLIESEESPHTAELALRSFAVRSVGGQSIVAQAMRPESSPSIPQPPARAWTMSSPCRPGSATGSQSPQGPPLSSTSMRIKLPSTTVNLTVKEPPGRRERLCKTALAASSEAQRTTSSAAGQSPSTARRSARTYLICSFVPGYVASSIVAAGARRSDGCIGPRTKRIRSPAVLSVLQIRDTYN
jgi:hypothetical protein